jgi:uncharacterized protein (DUF2267 family)
MRTVLHALRDGLTVDEAAAFRARLPISVRPLYFEDWHAREKPERLHKKGDLFADIAAAFRDDRDIDPEGVVRGIFRVLNKNLAASEVEATKALVPGELRSLWP